MSTAQTKDLAVSLYPHQRCGCVLKKSLWKCTRLDERCQNGCCLDKQRLLVVSLVLLALCGMVLLLLWNYQCFIVNHMCQDPERSSEYVLFEMDEQSIFHMDQPEAARPRQLLTKNRLLFQRAQRPRESGGN